jgi:hypothetical protein
MTNVFSFPQTGNAYAIPFYLKAARTGKALQRLRGDMIFQQVSLRRFALP